MSSMTIHGMDEQLERLIRERAQAEGQSLNKTLQRLLEEALGITPSPPQRHRSEFQEFFGVWTAEEKRAFKERTEDLRAIDEGDWR